MRNHLLILAVAFIICGLNVFFVSPVQAQGGCAAAPCDCTSVGGSFHSPEAKWCNYQLCYNQCMSERRGGGTGAGAAGGLSQPFFNLGNAIGQAIGRAIVGDPAEEAARRAEAEARARQAEEARQRAEEEARRRAEEEARKRQETFDRILAQAQLSEGFASREDALPVMLKDDGLRPQGASFFGLGGGAGGSTAGAAGNDNARRSQGYSATAAAPASVGGLPVMLRDSNVVDLSDKKPPYVVDPNTVKGGAGPPPVQTASAKPAAPAAPAPSSGDEFLFGVKGTFPKHPGQPLLNPLIELPKGESLPTKGETGDAFFARLNQTKLGRQIAEEEYQEVLFHLDTDKPYPRGQSPVVDRIIDQSIKKIVDRETKAIREACRKAAADMNAQFAEMEKKGIIKPGDNLAEKEKTDVVYDNELMTARHRIYGQLENDIRSAKVRSENNLWVVKRFADHVQDPPFMGGPTATALKDPKQMKDLLGKYMTYYSGDLK